jgi:hypothetical protein
MIDTTPYESHLRSLGRLMAVRDADRLNAIFRFGVVPDPPLDGAYAGRLLAVAVAPGITALADRIAALWMPWRGKTFDAARRCGDNIFSDDSWTITRLFSPGYRALKLYGYRSYRAFPFRASIGPGREDLDRQVLRIDYDLPVNPRWSVRRVLDELVQIDDELYLGKAHVRWWWGRWQCVAFFALSGAIEPSESPGH